MADEAEVQSAEGERSSPVPASMLNPDQGEGESPAGWRGDKKRYVVKAGKQFDSVDAQGRRLRDAGEVVYLEPATAQQFPDHLYDAVPDKDTLPLMMPPPPEQELAPTPEIQAPTPPPEEAPAVHDEPPVPPEEPETPPVPPEEHE